jgi:tryptophan-associated transmembrane protein
MSGSTGRQLARTVLECAVGAILALLAVSRTWRSVAGTATGHRITGTAVLPWASPVALVGLAGAGALLAVRGRARIVLGLVLIVSGLSLAIGAVYEVAAGRADLGWALLCAAGGLLMDHAGLTAVRFGATWPALGSRYERPVAEPIEPVEPYPQIERSGPSRSDVAMWDALDRGEDPTGRGEYDGRV